MSSCLHLLLWVSRWGIGKEKRKEKEEGKLNLNAWTGQVQELSIHEEGFDWLATQVYPLHVVTGKGKSADWCGDQQEWTYSVKFDGILCDKDEERDNNTNHAYGLAYSPLDITVDVNFSWDNAEIYIRVSLSSFTYARGPICLVVIRGCSERTDHLTLWKVATLKQPLPHQHMQRQILTFLIVKTPTYSRCPLRPSKGDQSSPMRLIPI